MNLVQDKFEHVLYSVIACMYREHTSMYSVCTKDILVCTQFVPSVLVCTEDILVCTKFIKVHTLSCSDFKSM